MQPPGTLDDVLAALIDENDLGTPDVGADAGVPPLVPEDTPARDTLEAIVREMGQDREDDPMEAIVREMEQDREDDPMEDVPQEEEDVPQEEDVPNGLEEPPVQDGHPSPLNAFLRQLNPEDDEMDALDALVREMNADPDALGDNLPLVPNGPEDGEEEARLQEIRRNADADENREDRLEEDDEEDEEEEDEEDEEDAIWPSTPERGCTTLEEYLARHPHLRPWARFIHPRRAQSLGFANPFVILPAMWFEMDLSETELRREANMHNNKEQLHRLGLDDRGAAANFDFLNGVPWDVDVIAQQYVYQEQRAAAAAAKKREAELRRIQRQENARLVREERARQKTERKASKEAQKRLDRIQRETERENRKRQRREETEARNRRKQTDGFWPPTQTRWTRNANSGWRSCVTRAPASTTNFPGNVRRRRMECSCTPPTGTHRVRLERRCCSRRCRYRFATR